MRDADKTGGCESSWSFFASGVLYFSWSHCGSKAQMFDSRVTGLAAEAASSLGRRGFSPKLDGGCETSPRPEQWC